MEIESQTVFTVYLSLTLVKIPVQPGHELLNFFKHEALPLIMVRLS